MRFLLPYSLAAIVGGLLFTGCSSSPIGPVTDFDFEFDELRRVDLGEEPDTSTVVVSYAPERADTLYLDTQNRFLADASAAPQSGSVPASIVAVAEAARIAFDTSTSVRLASMADEAGADPSAYIQSLNASLDDPTSDASAFAGQVTNLAQQQAALADLLGAVAASTAPKESLVPTPRVAPTRPLLETADLTLHGANSCAADARMQTQNQLGTLTIEKKNRDAALQRSLQRNLVLADTFRVRQIRSLVAERQRRTNQAKQFFVDVQNAIQALVQNGLITQATATDLSIVSVTVVLTRLNRARTFYVTSEASVREAADAIIASSYAKFEQQSVQLSTSFTQAVVTLQELETFALRDCHDQGTSTG